MTPLNLYLEGADDAQRIHAVREYGDAIRELATVNIFAGDLLFKNFGVTRYGRVVFYDYDEIEYLADCKFRRIPTRRPGTTKWRATSGIPVGPLDVFPEEFATFLLTDARVREAFMAFHRDLLDASWWQDVQRGIASGQEAEVLSYARAHRFAPARRNAAA